MAVKICCFCGREVSLWNGYTTVVETKECICPKCNEFITTQFKKFESANNEDELIQIRKETEAAIISGIGQANSLSVLLDKEMKKYHFEEASENVSSETEHNEVPEETLEELYDKLRHQVLLTTASTLEGYHIKEQLGVVFGETVYKPSASRQLASTVSDAFRSLSLSRKEMSGQVSLIEEARKFAYVKMISEAINRGANAIIAIDSDNTIGDGIFYTSLYGTAVYVEKH